MLLTLSLNAQVRFLGISIDGTKEDMISQLIKKGYTLCQDPRLAEYDMLEGEFNGREVHIAIATYNNKVYRVLVQDVKTINEIDIKIRYNTLIKQFQENPKYFYDSNDAKFLDDDFDVNYEMVIKNKQISAAFTQKLSKEDINKLESSNPELNGYGQKELEEYFKQNAYKSNTVWFKICKLKNYDDYWIAIYYDNLNNAPSGDDL